MISNSAFVRMAAAVSEADIAVAASGMFLFFSLGTVVGTSRGAAVFQAGLQSGIEIALHDTRGRHKVGHLYFFPMHTLAALLMRVQDLTEATRGHKVPLDIKRTAQTGCDAHVCAELSSSRLYEHHSIALHSCRCWFCLSAWPRMCRTVSRRCYL